MLSGSATSTENPQNINTPFYSSLKEGVAVQGMDVLTHLGQKATKLARAIATAEPSSSKARSPRFTTSVPSKWETLQNSENCHEVCALKALYLLWGHCCLVPPPLSPAYALGQILLS